MSYDSGATCRTFVLSITTSGRETERIGRLLTIGFKTFHEIIYGKSERGANERRVFFVPAGRGQAMFEVVREGLKSLSGQAKGSK